MVKVYRPSKQKIKECGQNWRNSSSQFVPRDMHVVYGDQIIIIGEDPNRYFESEYCKPC